MIVSVIVLGCLVIILSCLLFFSVRMNIRAGSMLIEYDKFYDKTTDDVEEMIQYFQKLSKRDLVSMDPDVQNVRKGLVIISDLLTEYINVGKEFKKGGNQSKKE